MFVLGYFLCGGDMTIQILWHNLISTTFLLYLCFAVLPLENYEDGVVWRFWKWNPLLTRVAGYAVFLVVLAQFVAVFVYIFGMR